MTGTLAPVRVHPAERQRQRAIAALDVGRPVVAGRLLDAAAAALDASDTAPAARLARGRVAITRAHVRFALEGLDAALRQLDDAERVVAVDDLPELALSLHNLRGVLLLRARRLGDAIQQFDRAWAAREAAPVLDRCKVLSNRAIAHMDLAALPAARADLRRCIATARAAGLDFFEVGATHNLGYVEFLAGNLPEALRLMDEAYAADPTHAPGIARLGKARVLVEAGLLREADMALCEAAAIFRRERLGHDLSETELDRARVALAVGDVAAARRFAGRARDRFRRNGNDQWRRVAELVLLRGDLAAGRPGGRLVAPARRLGEEFGRAGLPLDARTAGLIEAEAQLAQGGVDAAAEVVASLPVAGRHDPVTDRLHDHDVRARVHAAQGDGEEAAALVRRGLGELATHQSSFGSLEVAAAAAVHGGRLAQLDLRLAHASRPADLFAAAERTRAVTSRTPAVLPPEDPVLAASLAQLRQVFDELRDEQLPPDRAAALEDQRRELEALVAARGWTRTGRRAAARTVTLTHVQRTLAAADAVLVTYVDIDARLHALVVADGALAVHELAATARIDELVHRVRADLDVLAQPRLPGALRGAVLASYRRSMHSLDELLLPAAATDARTLVVSPTGSLTRLPWSDIASRRGRPTVVTPSATAWVQAASAAPTDRPDVAAFAGPDVGSGDAEVAAVRAAWPDAAVTTGADATGAALTAAMGRAAVVHIAAHGTHQTENPLFSCLRMADGPVFAHELDRLGAAPAHVVLSACELGLATVRPGDEALGLTSVLLRLGTRSVVAGVARVADEVAAATMADYHRRLAGGADSATALARALARNDPDRPAPFVCFGAAWSPRAS